jgi:CBS domain containing-hemolysin-like protein
VTLLFELIAVGVLIVLNAFFVAAEYALVTARRTRIVELQHQGNRRARDVLRITSDPPRFIAAMQLAVTLTSLGIGALGEQALANVFNDVLSTVFAVVLAYLVLTFLHVVLGELVPKGVALGHREGTALAVAVPVRVFFVVFRPFIWILERATELVLRALGLEPPGAENEPLSEAELRMVVSQSTRGGEIEQQEQEMLYKVFDFADKEASDVMVPRPEVVALSVDLPPEQCLEAVMDSPYTRYPVYRESLDNIVGILHVRDLFSGLRERGMHEVKVEDLVRPAHIVPETKDLAALLTEFRRTNQHMAIVVDEYGDMEGIVTLEDLLEEIVGEIEDEFDLPDESVEQVDDDTIRIDGTFPIDDFNERFGTDLPDEDYHTVAGFVFGVLGRQPEVGDDISHDGMRFDVVEVEGSRINKIAVTFEERRDQKNGKEAAARADLDAELFDADN